MSTRQVILHPEIPIVGYDTMMTESEFLQHIKSRNSGTVRFGDIVQTTPEEDADNKRFIALRFEQENG